MENKKTSKRNLPFCFFLNRLLYVRSCASVVCITKCAYMYICIYVYMYIHVYTYTSKSLTLSRTLQRVPFSIRYTFVCVCIYIYIYMYICMFFPYVILMLHCALYNAPEQSSPRLPV
jgi:hypothetical protein